MGRNLSQVEGSKSQSVSERLVAPTERAEPSAGFTPGPWEYIPSNDHHGAYVTGPYGGDICDCYAMSDPSSPSVRNGGKSRPIPFRDHDANARLIAAAPTMYAYIAVRAAAGDREAIQIMEAVRGNA